MGFYPALFPLFFLGTLYVLLRGAPSVTLLLFTVFAIGLWFESSLSEWWRDSRYFYFQAEHVAVSVGLFILLYAFSHWLYKKDVVVARDYGAELAAWSLRFGLLFMLVMSFEGPWEDLLSADWAHRVSMALISLGFSVLVLCLAALGGKLRSVGTLVFVYLTISLSISAVMNWYNNRVKLVER